ncbi:hypothetical protein BC829DRAFT_57904 [Chytridium lagenaria]|nr:hypothetical protein BC829DRAFT_57904 [Chytridium lagenaria]
MPKRFSAVQKGGTGSRRASLVMPAEEMFNFAVNRAMEMDNDGIIAMDAGKVKIGGERRRNIGEVGKAGKVEGNDGDRPSRADQGRSSRRTSASIRRSTATGRGVRRPPDISDPLATSTSLPNSNDTLASLSPRRTTTQKVPKPLSILQRMSTSASQGSKSNIDENKIIVGTPSGQYEDPQLEINDAWLRQAACAMQLSVGSYLAIIGAVMVCFIFATNDGIFPAKCEKGHSDISRQTIALRGCVVVLMQVSVDLVVFSVGERMGFRYMLASQIKIPLVIVVGMGLNVASLASNLMMAFRGEADGIFFAEKRECLPI